MALIPAGAWAVTLMVPGCSSDERASNGAGAGGADAGGGGGGSAGTGGLPNTGGGGSGGASHEAGTDSGDAGCVPPGHLVYRSPGCDGTVIPRCERPVDGADGGLGWACACDGKSILGGGGFLKPYRHLGECTDASVLDAGSDSGSDAH